MRKAFISSLIEHAKTDESLIVMTADLGFTVFEEFAEAYPGRFINAGIAEANMVGLAAGLATTGHTVFAYSIATFASMRCLEQFRTDVCLHKLPVILVGAGGGYGYGAAGPTHHAVEDLALMRALPNNSVWTPGDPEETSRVISGLARDPRPAYVRIGKVGEPPLPAPPTAKDAPLHAARRLSEGSDALILSIGNISVDVADAVSQLAGKKHALSHIHFPAIRPLDEDAIVNACAATNARDVFIVEEHILNCGFYGAVAEFVGSQGLGLKLHALGIPTTMDHTVGNQSSMRARAGIDVASIVNYVESTLAK